MFLGGDEFMGFFETKKSNRRRGQSTIEYILILAVVVIIALKFKKTATTQIRDLTDNVFKDINDVADKAVVED